MSIKWNEYTWYSKLAAAIFFILILPAWTFYIGTQYQRAYSENQSIDTYVEESELNILNIKENPIITDDATPTITGTYKGDYGVEIVITKNGKEIVVDSSDHGGGVELSSNESTSGIFTYTVWKPLEPGTYNLNVYVFHTIYSDKGYVGHSPLVLTASTTLIVR